MQPANLSFINLQFGGMSVEMTMLALAILLGFVQLFLAAHFVTAERGLGWNVGARDNTAPLSGHLAGRLDRAFQNFKETFPFFAAAVIMAAVLGRHNWATLWGSQIYLAARILYVPLYAMGVPVVRTLVWAAASAGILLVVAALFMA
jgi:uncharacterized MAPEG superfamily protein